MQTVGIRDLKNRLTHYLETAKKGEAVIITDRGRPVAILHNLEQVEEKAGLEERLASFSKQGFLILPKTRRDSGLLPLDRAKVRGEPVSDTIIKVRR